MNGPARREGFTLIELLLYVALVSAMLLTISVFLANIFQARVKNQTIAEVEQQGLQIMQEMTQAARNSEAITAPIVGASGVSLALDVVAVVDDPTVFAESGSVLQITEGVGSAVDLHGDSVTASGLTFTNVSYAGTPGAVRIEFTLTHVNPSGRNEYDYSKTFYGTAALR